MKAGEGTLSEEGGIQVDICRHGQPRPVLGSDARAHAIPAHNPDANNLATPTEYVQNAFASNLD